MLNENEKKYLWKYPSKYPYRLQVFVPIKASFWIDQIQQIKHVHYHGPGHYSMMYYSNNLQQLKRAFGASLSIDFDPEEYPAKEYKKRNTSEKRQKPVALPKHAEAIGALEQRIILKQYSYSTLKTYKHCFTKFLWHFNDKHPKDISSSRKLCLHLVEMDFGF